MLSLLFVCSGVIKFHLSPTHTYISSTTPIDHDLVVKNQLTNEDRNPARIAPDWAHHRTKGTVLPAPPTLQCEPVVCIPCWMIQALEPTFSVLFFSWYKGLVTLPRKTLYCLLKNCSVQNQDKCPSMDKGWANPPHYNNKQCHQLRTF